MFLIFCLNRKDVLPTEDGAFITAFKLAYNFKDDTRDKRYIKEYCTKWKPYSSYVVRYIYKAFDAGLL
ncbi:3-methyladenine DNA glycosylase/8-oxoguanine DNA glycosylase [Mycoplasmopsis arginini]|nr:3-methyladenine DNA glycosylase/8-oxoguanine DNA glycosylase [Mycoplasmopsis arginini]